MAARVLEAPSSKKRDVQRDPDIHKQQGALSGDRQEREAVLSEFRSGETDEHQA
jgi:hypothetical protein